MSSIVINRARKKEIETTDRIYGGEYDHLFPNIADPWEEVANAMDKPASGLSIRFLNHIEKKHAEFIVKEKKIPTITDMECETWELIEEMILEALERDYGDDPLWAEDSEEGSEFRDVLFMDYLEIFNNSSDGQSLTADVIEALGELRLMYINDREEDYEEGEHPAQIEVFRKVR